MDLAAPVCHVSQYEADAYARWRGQRLPTEFEWEAAAVANQSFDLGATVGMDHFGLPALSRFYNRRGSRGGYNGKFMSGQMVLRGASVATPAGHYRPTYRNFFQPDKQWQFSGIRLVEHKTTATTRSLAPTNLQLALAEEVQTGLTEIAQEFVVPLLLRR